MEKDYITVLKCARDELVEKRSRFIGCAKPVTSEAEAVAFIAERRSEHWNAKHNVYAYSLREGGVKRYNDDSEPSGTAGMPVLDVITKSGVCDVCVVVTRYFGGILLGTGGLIRAYSSAAKIALDAAKIVEMRLCVTFELKCPYNLYGRLSSAILSLGGEIDGEVFEEDVSISAHIRPELFCALEKSIADAASGTVSPRITGEKHFVFENQMTIGE